MPAAGVSEPSSQVESPEDPPPGGAVNLGDFPVPAPPGGAVGRVISDSARGITYGASDMDAIVAFYENWLSEAGLKSQFGLVVTELSGQMSLQASTEDGRPSTTSLPPPVSPTYFSGSKLLRRKRTRLIGGARRAIS